MPQRLQKLSELLNISTSAVLEYSHTATSKALAIVGGASAGVQITSKWYDPIYTFLAEFPWVSLLSLACLILLFIERSFIVWAWWRKYKRGEL